MSPAPPAHALVLRHRAISGRRDELIEVWRRNMPEAVTENDGHVAYVLCASYSDPDELLIFQHYRDAAAAQQFLGNPAYLRYLEESRHLLSGPPEVEPVEPLWSKEPGPDLGEHGTGVDGVTR
ncbi:putative quinol monooxygenase [Dietzia aurantiaca]|uniref:Quinol monooxygenase n=1 Tax=Dietzia aurantiaca TaxID=983873 RepID=A0ABV9PQX1_9ACTN